MSAVDQSELPFPVGSWIVRWPRGGCRVGGPDDSERGEVVAIERAPDTGWLITTKNGDKVHSRNVRAVAIKAADGGVASAWMVSDWLTEGLRGHHLDGHRTDREGLDDGRAGAPAAIVVDATPCAEAERDA